MDVLMGLVTLIGLAGAIIGLGLVIAGPFMRGRRLRRNGGVCIALGVLCLVAGMLYGGHDGRTDQSTGGSESGTTAVQPAVVSTAPTSEQPRTEVTEAQAEPEQDDSAGALTKTLLAKVSVTVELQSAYDSQGRQKAVVWVKNGTDKVLAGALGVMVMSDEGFSRGASQFILNPVQPGCRTWAVMWLRTDFGGGADPRVVWHETEFTDPDDE